MTTAELRQIAAVLERLEDGVIAMPRVPGAIGMFMRQFPGARQEAQRRLAIEPPEDGWISGERLMPVELVPITPLQMRVDNSPMGSVTSAVAVSETLGGSVRVSLWGAARTAGRLLRIWRRTPLSVVRLDGRYRWHPPSRITPGEARIEATNTDLEWDRARCLKYTGDDVGRAPPAAAFHPDWLNQPPAIKAFRTLAIRRDKGWRVIPGLMSTPPAVEVIVPEELLPARDVPQLLVLAWTLPWEPLRWRVIKALEATNDDVLAHQISWADHVRELRGEGPVPGEVMRALERRLHEVGLVDTSIERAVLSAQLTRRVDRRALAYAGWLRGVT